MANIAKEPSTAPDPEKWYPFTLGSSLAANSNTKFCSLRYEFKPASIDLTRPGSLQKSKENKVTVEFNNNQPGKPNCSFQGSVEDCKDLDAVLFFDGQNFRLERLHKAVKSLRYVREPGESAAAATSAPAASTAGNGFAATAAEARSPPARVSKGAAIRTTLNSAPVAIERIDIGEPENTSPAGKKNGKRTADEMSAPSPLLASPEEKSNDEEEHVDVDDDEDVVQVNHEMLSDTHEANVNIDDNVSNGSDSDDEIADVDLSDDEADKGPNAAEALRAQVDAEQNEKQQTSSSSGTSSGSSGSGTASSSSDSEGSDDDSASSGGDN
ncbi:hypothetical protein SUGI_0104170 [Cryptomeria japonica]|uniref:uncharacterized protein LOC131047399 n=1 Tax=Cryptomeria japonica TaxID=3369 RepID=UPI002408F0B6|nr:uncharacterized protein LOC131047399 [Cryptomeria japonica]GLJ09226.1 hypothetical protein SUGI_0104170 [Cryptomeria japonica]